MVKILRALGLIVLVGSLSVLTSCRKSSEDDKKLWTLEIDVKGCRWCGLHMVCSYLWGDASIGRYLDCDEKVSSRMGKLVGT